MYEERANFFNDIDIFFPSIHDPIVQKTIEGINKGNPLTDVMVFFKDMEFSAIKYGLLQAIPDQY